MNQSHPHHPLAELVSLMRHDEGARSCTTREQDCTFIRSRPRQAPSLRHNRRNDCCSRLIQVSELVSVYGPRNIADHSADS